MQSREGMPLGRAGCRASQRGPMHGPAMDGGRPVAAADHAADGDDGDVDQQVLAVARVARVGERLEVRADRADIDELGRGGIPGSVEIGLRANHGVRRCDHFDRVQAIKPRPVARDYPGRTVMRAGHGYSASPASLLPRCKQRARPGAQPWPPAPAPPVARRSGRSSGSSRASSSRPRRGPGSPPATPRARSAPGPSAATRVATSSTNCGPRSRGGGRAARPGLRDPQAGRQLADHTVAYGQVIG